jgi:uncharacterized membrane protein (Fun14 family)
MSIDHYHSYYYFAYYLSFVDYIYVAMMQFDCINHKTLLGQCLSGLLLGFMIVFIACCVHSPLMLTIVSILIGWILTVDLLHFLGKINIDISNLCQYDATRRTRITVNLAKEISFYIREHVVFLLTLFLSSIVTRWMFIRK